MECPDASELQEVLEATAGPERHDAIVAHAEECERCRELLAGLFGRGAPAPGEPGSRIGPFVVTERLGMGAMGMVVLAHDPDLDRHVAIKLLGSDHATGDEPEAWRARLLREAQAMAKLVHPNVVTVHQVGTVDDQVFVVMEYVDGGTLARWLREKPRSWREVRDVFERAGRGLAAAHAAGLVHRDFKPDNVLVGSDGRVRVTDFGLVGVEALPSTPSPAMDLALTASGTLIGTPIYMAPEQHDRKPVDARADQFAFCVALYQALFHERPFAGDTIEALATEVRSGRLREPKGRCPAWLRRTILRGLRRDPDERYPSMEALLADLGRDRVLARRRAFIVGFAALLSAAAVTGWLARHRPRCDDGVAELAGTWDPSVRAAVAARFSATGRPWAQATFDRFAQRLDGYTARWTGMHEETCLATEHGAQSAAALDLRMGCLRRRLVEARALTALVASADAETLTRSAQMVDGLADVADCGDLDRLRLPMPPPKDPAARAAVDRARAVLAAAKAQASAGRFREAVVIAAPALVTAEALGYKPLEAEVRYALGYALGEADDANGSEAQLRKAILVADAARHDEVRLDALLGLVRTVGERLNRFADAMRLGDEAEAALERWGEDRLRRATLLMYTGRVLQEEGKLAEARVRYEEALALRERTLGGVSLDGARVLGHLGDISVLEYHLDDAAGFYRRSAAVAEAAVGPAHPYVGAIDQELSWLALNRGDLARAEELGKRAVDVLEEGLGRDHMLVLQTVASLGAIVSERGRHAEGRAYVDRALVAFERPGADQGLLAKMLRVRARIDLEQGKAADALPRIVRALALTRQVYGDDNGQVASKLLEMSYALVMLGRPEEAAERARAALAMFTKELGAENPDVQETRTGLARALAAGGHLAEADTEIRRAVASLTRSLGADHLTTAAARTVLAEVLLRQKRPADALLEASAAAAAEEKMNGPDQPALVKPLTIEGQALIAVGRGAEAIPILQRARAIAGHFEGDPQELADVELALARARRR